MRARDTNGSLRIVYREKGEEGFLFVLRVYVCVCVRVCVRVWVCGLVTVVAMTLLQACTLVSRRAFRIDCPQRKRIPLKKKKDIRRIKRIASASVSIEGTRSLAATGTRATFINRVCPESRLCCVSHSAHESVQRKKRRSPTPSPRNDSFRIGHKSKPSLG